MTQTPTPDRSGDQRKPHRGVLILVFGILGIVVCFIFGIAAWVMGNNDLAEMKAGTMDREGEGMTNAGRVCGIVGVALQAAGILIQLLLIIMFGTSTAASAGGGG